MLRVRRFSSQDNRKGLQLNDTRLQHVNVYRDTLEALRGDRQLVFTHLQIEQEPARLVGLHLCRGRIGRWQYPDLCLPDRTARLIGDYNDDVRR